MTQRRARFHSSDDLRKLARSALPKMVFDYIEGGAGDENCCARNMASFAQATIAPRRLTDVAARDLSVSPFGRRWAHPFAVAPMGLTGAIRPGGDLILARQAAIAGVPYCLSTASTSSIEEVRAVSDGDVWFQLYVVERSLADSLVERARAADCGTLVLTVDVAVNGDRRRDARSGFGLPFRYTPRIVADAACHPAWATRQLLGGMPQLAHFRATGAQSADAQAALLHRQMDATFGWDDLRRLRDMWKGRLIVKGIMRSDDAITCESIGVDGIVVSNHGGRQFEQSPSALSALEQIAPEVQFPVLMDGGIRSGADVLTALSRGASGALIGRPLLYALAAGGEAAVAQALAMFRRQFDTAMALSGCATVADIASLEGRDGVQV